VKPDPPARTLDDLAHESQADSGSLLVVVLGVEPLESPKNAFLEFRGNADAIVPDTQVATVKAVLKALR
jgi:hypothetical protein